MISGIYYERKSIAVGTMGTSKMTAGFHELHYYCKEKEGGEEVDIYYLKPDATPTAIVVETATMDDFKKRFLDCTTHACSFRQKSPEEKKAEDVAEKVRLGEKHLEKKEYNAATFEFGRALKQDGKNLHAHFGKGKAHIALGEVDKAREHFGRMAENEELYDEEHKHLFNELGIELRKNGLYEEAIVQYEKALSINPKDEALYYNMARAYKEWGNQGEALKNIRKALDLKPDFGEGLSFLKSLK